MVYLLESELPKNKSIFFALMNVYGIGKTNAELICKKLGFSKNLKVKELSKEQVNKLIILIESFDLELSSNLKRLNILVNQKLISIKSYRGIRKSQGLPVRGQRTHTNAKTARKKH
jgi:small subunit ribosomal protein S13